MKKKVLYFFIFSCGFSVFSESPTVFVEKIRLACNYLKDSPIGCIDADGKYTRNSGNGLNCSGFVKWIADGFYMPLRREKGQTPLYMSIQELRTKHPENRGDRYTLYFEASRDPYFGLDWTRNIAVQLGNLRDNKKYGNEHFDVRNSTVLSYVEDRGYPSSKIEKVLVEQAKKYPTRWYLGSISGPFGRKPRLHQHYHVVAFIPYTDKKGNTKIAVFERNKETSFNYLLQRYPNTYCHLVWLGMDGEFELMTK